MSAARKLARRNKRIGSGDMRRAHEEANRRARRYYELTGKVVVPTLEQVRKVAEQLASSAD